MRCGISGARGEGGGRGGDNGGCAHGGGVGRPSRDPPAAPPMTQPTETRAAGRLATAPDEFSRRKVSHHCRTPELRQTVNELT